MTNHRPALDSGHRRDADAKKWCWERPSKGASSAASLHDSARCTSKSQAAFYDFDEFERVASEAERLGTVPYLVVLLGGEAGLRCGENDGPGMGASRPQEAPTRRRSVRLERHVTVPKGGRDRYDPLTTRSRRHCSKYGTCAVSVCCATGRAVH
jgi:hypothetical protein